jgi:hypothetical protein|nr:hypothetical protein Q903MT_gene3467 [Picea sitchensis]
MNKQSEALDERMPHSMVDLIMGIIRKRLLDLIGSNLS